MTTASVREFNRKEKEGVRTPPNRALHPSTVSASKLPFACIGALAVVWAWLGISKKIGRHIRHKGSPEYTSPRLGSRSQGGKLCCIAENPTPRGAAVFSFYFYFSDGERYAIAGRRSLQLWGANANVVRRILKLTFTAVLQLSRKAKKKNCMSKIVL